MLVSNGTHRDAEPDVTVQNHGTLALFRPNTRQGQRWIDVHFDGDALRWGRAIVIEPRYLDQVLEGAIADGLVVRL